MNDRFQDFFNANHHIVPISIDEAQDAAVTDDSEIIETSKEPTPIKFSGNDSEKNSLHDTDFVNSDSIVVASPDEVSSAAASPDAASSAAASTDAASPDADSPDAASPDADSSVAALPAAASLDADPPIESKTAQLPHVSDENAVDSKKQKKRKIFGKILGNSVLVFDEVQIHKSWAVTGGLGLATTRLLSESQPCLIELRSRDPAEHSTASKKFSTRQAI
ncbi:hypothetical protein TNCV_4884011 [Trichonephila clavipes]|nr:hypothetical protein TNCV_4884011 [Trichonephila clavipes]